MGYRLTKMVDFQNGLISRIFGVFWLKVIKITSSILSLHRLIISELSAIKIINYWLTKALTTRDIIFKTLKILETKLQCYLEYHNQILINYDYVPSFFSEDFSVGRLVKDEPRRVPCSYLSCAQSNDKICNKCVLGFSAAVTDHNSPAITLRQFASGRQRQNICSENRARSLT